MQPRQIQKQPREHKVPVTIKSLITLLFNIEHHMRSVRAAGLGVGEDREPGAEAQEMCGVSEGQQKTAVTVGRAYSPLTTQSTLCSFLVKVWGLNNIFKAEPSRTLHSSWRHCSSSSSSQHCSPWPQLGQFAQKWPGPMLLPCADQTCKRLLGKPDVYWLISVGRVCLLKVALIW